MPSSVCEKRSISFTTSSRRDGAAATASPARKSSLVHLKARPEAMSAVLVADSFSVLSHCSIRREKELSREAASAWKMAGRRGGAAEGNDRRLFSSCSSATRTVFTLSFLWLVCRPPLPRRVRSSAPATDWIRRITCSALAW